MGELEGLQLALGFLRDMKKRQWEKACIFTDCQAALIAMFTSAFPGEY